MPLVAIIAIIAVVAIVVLVVVAVAARSRGSLAAGTGPAYLPGPPRALPAGGFSGGEAVLNPQPNQIQPGDEVGLKRGPGEPTMYVVTAGAHFSEPGEDDEHWTEFELQRVADDRVFFLEYERDDEHRWVWVLSRKLKAAELDMELAFTTIGVGKKDQPPEELEWGGRMWRVIQDSHHYKVDVTDWRIDRPEKHEYRARFTDYREMGGEQELSLEIWEGGYGLTVKEARITEVTLIKRK
jgi:Domain of unknown function (DUF4178)